MGPQERFVTIYDKFKKSKGFAEEHLLQVAVITYLFTKLSWPAESKESFRSSSQAASCLSYKVKASHCPF